MRPACWAANCASTPSRSWRPAGAGRTTSRRALSRCAGRWCGARRLREGVGPYARAPRRALRPGPLGDEGAEAGLRIGQALLAQRPEDLVRRRVGDPELRRELHDGGDTRTRRIGAVGDATTHHLCDLAPAGDVGSELDHRFRMSILSAIGDSWNT